MQTGSANGIRSQRRSRWNEYGFVSEYHAKDRGASNPAEAVIDYKLMAGVISEAERDHIMRIMHPSLDTEDASTNGISATEEAHCAHAAAWDSFAAKLQKRTPLPVPSLFSGPTTTTGSSIPSVSTAGAGGDAKARVLATAANASTSTAMGDCGATTASPSTPERPLRRTLSPLRKPFLTPSRSFRGVTVEGFLNLADGLTDEEQTVEHVLQRSASMPDLAVLAKVRSGSALRHGPQRMLGSRDIPLGGVGMADCSANVYGHRVQSSTSSSSWTGSSDDEDNNNGVVPGAAEQEYTVISCYNGKTLASRSCPSFQIKRDIAATKTEADDIRTCTAGVADGTPGSNASMSTCLSTTSISSTEENPLAQLLVTMATDQQTSTHDQHTSTEVALAAGVQHTTVDNTTPALPGVPNVETAARGRGHSRRSTHQRTRSLPAEHLQFRLVSLNLTPAKPSPGSRPRGRARKITKVANSHGTAVDPHGTVVIPHGTVLSPHGTVVSPHGTVVSPLGHAAPSETQTPCVLTTDARPTTPPPAPTPVPLPPSKGKRTARRLTTGTMTGTMTGAQETMSTENSRAPELVQPTGCATRESTAAAHGFTTPSRHSAADATTAFTRVGSIDPAPASPHSSSGHHGNAAPTPWDLFCAYDLTVDESFVNLVHKGIPSQYRPFVWHNVIDGYMCVILCTVPMLLRRAKSGVGIHDWCCTLALKNRHCTSQSVSVLPHRG